MLAKYRTGKAPAKNQSFEMAAKNTDAEHMEGGYFSEGSLVEARHPIDQQHISDYLMSQGAISGPVLSIKQFDSGTSNPTYMLVTEADGKLVLRKQPPGELLAGAHQVDREYKVMAALFEQGMDVPRMVHYCEDESVLGTKFYCMGYCHGRIFEDTTLPGMTAAERRAAYSSMAQNLAKMHSMDYKSTPLANFGREGGYLQRQVKAWGRQVKARSEMVCEHKDDASMFEIEAWVTKEAERWSAAGYEDRSCVVHGDYRLGNIVLSPDKPEVLAVLGA